MSTLTESDIARDECCAKSPGDRARDAIEDILAACDEVEDGVAEAYGDDFDATLAALTTREIRDLIARAKAAPRG